jgi:hypothetical protein
MKEYIAKLTAEVDQPPISIHSTPRASGSNPWRYRDRER